MQGLTSIGASLLCEIDVAPENVINDYYKIINSHLIKHFTGSHIAKHMDT